MLVQVAACDDAADSISQSQASRCRKGRKVLQDSHRMQAVRNTVR